MWVESSSVRITSPPGPVAIVYEEFALTCFSINEDVEWDWPVLNFAELRHRRVNTLK